MIICNCFGIDSYTVDEYIALYGDNALEKLRELENMGSNCGSCLDDKEALTMELECAILDSNKE